MTDSSIPPIIPVPPEEDPAEARERWQQSHALTPEQVALARLVL